ncbi:MAG: ADP-ribosylation factor-like protein [Planctomycetaceae bacterium]|nr:ADP-ribosylation factor-like protein [Planctomycetaceae bacterium]
MGDFGDEIKERLKGLSREQICQFAWLCGMRALPFLSAKRAFVYWKENKRQEHLYSIFNALDICAVVADEHGKVSPPPRAAYSAAAYSAAYSAASSSAAYSAASASSAAAYASSSAAYSAASASSAAVRAADYAYADVAAFQKILYADLEAIKTNNLATLNNDTSIYGEIWQHFLDDLNAIGCGYWARLYEDLFKNKFVLDVKELKRRLSVPESVRSLGAKDVAHFLTQLQTGRQTRLNEARILILGEMGAGKTSLAKKLLDPDVKLSPTEASTEGVDIFLWELEPKEGVEKMNVHIWDFAGHSYTHTAHRYFMAERCVYIIVYDGRTESRNDLEKWLNHVKTYGGNSPVYVLINKRVANPLKINENTLKNKFRDSIKDFVYLSLEKDIDKVTMFQEEVAHLLRTDPVWDNKFPETWFTVKQKLENHFKKQGSELIDTDTFNNIAKEAGVDSSSDLESMKRILDVLGICLWYKEIPNLQAYVLDPNWISHAVYKIINWLGEKEDHKYELYLDDFSVIFGADKDAKRYPNARYRFLFDLLKHYKLAYPAKGEESQRLILPSMLPEDQPEPGMEDDFSIKDSLLMRYKVSGEMPLDTIARFIVCHHQEIMEENGEPVVWRYGVALQDNEKNYAVVIEDGQEIRLSVKGKTALTFFEALRSSLNDIFKDYKSENPELEYAITETRDKVIYEDGDTISAFARNNQTYIEGKTNQVINMTYIEKQYNISGGNTNLGGHDNVNATGIASVSKIELPHEEPKKSGTWLSRWWKVIVIAGVLLGIPASLLAIYQFVF